MKSALFIFLISAQCSSDCTTADVLARIRPGAHWSTQGDQISQWFDDPSTKPTNIEISNALSACKANQDARAALKQQARLDVKNTTLTQAQRLQALLILLDYDQ